MARAVLKVYHNSLLIRRAGGNNSKIRKLYEEYMKAPEAFHPWLRISKGKVEILVEYNR